MPPSRLLLALALALAVAGCASSPESRISASPSAFSSYSPDVQAKIRAGLVGIGFTQDQVRLARGEPDDRAVRQTPAGQSEDWFYGDHRARLGIGIGAGSVGPNSAVGGSVSTGGIPLGTSHVLQVTFAGGVVTAIEGPAQTPIN